MADQNNSEDSDSLKVLHEILDCLERRLPMPPLQKPWWKPRGFHIWIAALLLALAFLDFPSESSSKADITVLNGSEISIVKLPEPDWDLIGVQPSSDYWSVPDLPSNVSVKTLWEVSLYRQGQRYQHSGIRVIRGDNEPFVDLLSEPVQVDGPTVIVLNAISELKDSERLQATRIIRTRALKAGDQIVPLNQLFDSNMQGGRLVINTRPRIGWERFMSNLSTAFGLLK